MKITMLGVITALKNLGLTFLMAWSITDIQANPEAFIYAFIVYALVSVPSDLYLLNRAHEDGKGEK